MPDSRSIGLLCLLATSIGWGLNWPAMKFLLQEWPPLFARGTSGLCAALIIALIAAATGRNLTVPRAYFGWISLSAFFNIFAWMGFSTLSMRWLNAGQGALLVYTMPVWATLLAWPFLGRKPSAKSIVGLALCLAGIALLFGGSTSGIGAGKLPGVLFALAAAMLFALGTVALKPLPIDPLALVSWQLAIGCLPMVLFGILFEGPELSALSFRGGAVMVYMTLVPMGLCYIMWFAALRRVPPALASIATLLTPVVGVFAAALSLGEPLGLRELGAMALTLTGVATALMTTKT